MFFQIILSLFIGILSGIFTGLIPGVHVNLITVLVLGLASSFTGISPLIFAVFIISLALTHSFLDSIPSVFLGAPDESMVVAILPGHQLLHSGRGHTAVVYTLIGSLSSLVFCLLIFPYAFKSLSFLSQFVSPFIPYLLMLVILILLILSKKFFPNLFFFFLSGSLGLLCFQLVSQRNILLPLLSGLFGVSTLLVSLVSTSSLPKQFLKRRIVDVCFNDIFRNSSRATISGSLASFLPGLGSSQAAIMAISTMKEKSPKDYLILVGGINTVNFVFSLLTVVILGKARNGAIVGVNQIMGDLGIFHLMIFICVVLMAGGLAVPLGLILSRWFAKQVTKIKYSHLICFVISFIFILVVIFSGLQGVLILLVSTSLGLLANFFGVQKNVLLGCLILPVIVYLI